MTITQRRNRLKKLIKNKGLTLSEVAHNIKTDKHYSNDNSKIKSMLNGLEYSKTNKTFSKYEELFIESFERIKGE